jgi:hypothetical protein
LQTIVEEAHRNYLKVAAHAHGLDGIIAAIRAGVSSIEHGSQLNDEAIALMKAKGTYLVPTLYVAQPESKAGGQPMSAHMEAKGNANVSRRRCELSKGAARRSEDRVRHRRRCLSARPQPANSRSSSATA